MSTETALHTALLQFERLAIDWYALCTLVEAAETARRHVERGDFAPWWNARRITLTRAALRLSRQVAYTHTKSCGAALTSLEQTLLQTSNASLVAEHSRESFIKAAQRLERAPALPSALEGERVEDVPFQRSDVELDFATAEVAGLCLDLQQPYRAYVSLLSPREASQCSYLRFLRVLATLPQTTDLVSWLSSNPVAISADDQEWVETSREGAMQQPRRLPEKNILRAYANVLAFIHQYLVDFAWRAMPWLSPADWEQIRSVVVDDDCESETAADNLQVERSASVSTSAGTRTDSSGILTQQAAHAPRSDASPHAADRDSRIRAPKAPKQASTTKVAAWRALEIHLGALLGRAGQGPFHAALMRTIRRVERRQAYSLEEWAFAAQTEQVTVESIAYQRNGHWFLRPTPEPAQQDAENRTPATTTSASSLLDDLNIPSWLRRAYALHQVYRCEICDPVSEYRGPLAYERHFRSPVHLRGLHRLGIQYTADWDYVDNVEDALRLKAHLKHLHTKPGCVLSKRYARETPSAIDRAAQTSVTPEQAGHNDGSLTRAG